MEISTLIEFIQFVFLFQSPSQYFIYFFAFGGREFSIFRLFIQQLGNLIPCKSNTRNTPLFFGGRKIISYFKYITMEFFRYIIVIKMNYFVCWYISFRKLLINEFNTEKYDKGKPAFIFIRDLISKILEKRLRIYSYNITWRKEGDICFTVFLCNRRESGSRNSVQKAVEGCLNSHYEQPHCHDKSLTENNA